ncbi:MAG: hypothetical protein IJ326_05575 [Lachnospiraceae bacterium]|nr:hypothetical protein [Lachnospiraceae bacterium]
MPHSRAARERAQGRLSSGGADIDMIRAEAALRRSITRIR